ncbi:MAG: SpoIIE family protein phosphatase [Crocinitomicaceae bacterium]|nr:SpoIIE family protein phosphatase [Crocinitomicaceae bacterium]MBK8925377.1 SpoIIE family protein phosphatase [Crocinitomicaceae bacterium]
MRRKFLRLSLVIAVLLVGHNLFAATEDSLIIADLIKKSNEIYYENPDSSYRLCCEAEKKSQYYGNTQFMGDIAHCKARYHLLVTDYDLSATEINFAIQIFEQQKNYPKLSRAYSLKSILLDRIGEPDASTNMLREAYFISKNHGDRDGEIGRLINLSLDFIERNYADSAYHYLLLLEALQSSMDERDRYFLEQNLGLYYHLTEDYTKAVYYFNRAWLVADQQKMTDSKATICARLAESYLALNMLNEAEKFALESYQIAVDNKLIFEEEDAVIQLVKVYEAQENYQRAFDFRGRLIEVEERINKIEKVQQLKEDEYKLSLTVKEKELAEKENVINAEKLKSAEAKNQNMLLYFVLVLVVLILVFTVYIYLQTSKLNKAIALSKTILEQRNKEIMDSIHYAKQIQDAILPPVRYVSEILPDNFIFYRPKDVVAGDFYWIEQTADKIYFAVADCTGHGVPGAMVSVICHNALNRSLKEFGFSKPSEILEKTSELVVETFVKSDREVKDGMDIALCAFDKNNFTLQFAGANNPVWIMKSIHSENLGTVSPKNLLASEDKVLIEIRGNRQPIGYFEKKQVFLNQTVQLEKGDVIYLSSDGYFDQFGGDKGKKIKSKNFKEKLLNIQNFTMKEQQEMIISLFDTWKGDFEQVDDICVMGVRV